MSANKTNGPGRETAVLLYDVETSPNLAYVWGKYEQNVLGDFVQERQIISVAWKWLGEKEIHVLSLAMLPGYEGGKPVKNKALILKLHALFSKADIVVGHNVDEFDDKMSNTDFLKHELPPPPPHKTVDTLKVAKGKFRLNSNSLGYLGQFLGIGRKVKHWGFELWVRCLNGDPVAWALMQKYNKGDVALLERVYMKLRPWMTNHPSMTALEGKLDRCPLCRGKNLMRQGWSLSTGGSRRQRFQCQDCKKWSVGAVVNDGWRFK